MSSKRSCSGSLLRLPSQNHSFVRSSSSRVRVWALLKNTFRARTSLDRGHPPRRPPTPPPRLSVWFFYRRRRKSSNHLNNVRPQNNCKWDFFFFFLVWYYIYLVLKISVISGSSLQWPQKTDGEWTLSVSAVTVQYLQSVPTQSWWHLLKVDLNPLNQTGLQQRQW